MSSVTGAALVGRADEVYRLRECVRAVAQGPGTIVLLDGDAGAGKSRLVAEALKAPSLPRGYAAVCAGALDYARAPYAPIRDVLVALDKRFPKVLAGDSALAQALRPVLEFKELDPAPEGGDQRRVLDAIVAAFGKYAAVAPIVIAIEDVHWIDGASAAVLVHLARNIAALRAMLLVSFRGAEAQAHEQARNALAHLARNASLALSLRPLSNTDAMLLVDDVAPRELPMSVRREVCSIACGNPLLLIELTKLAAEHPDKLHGTLPITLKALVEERLADFDAGELDVLRVAAEMGEFEVDVLAEIARVERERVLSALRKARSASIVEERRSVTPFVFRHALIRQAITDDLLELEREDLHRRIAARLEQMPDRPELHARLAHHFWHARDVQKSRRYNALAAERASSVFAFADAAVLYERAIDARILDSETTALYRALADAYAGAHRTADAASVMNRLLEAAIARGDESAIAQTAFQLSRCYYEMLDDERSITTVQQALAHVDELRNAPHAFNLWATLGWYLAHLRRIEAAHAALSRARALLEHGDDTARIRYYEAWAAQKVHTGTQADEYRSDLEEAIRIARSSQDAAGYLRRLDNAIGLSMASTLDDMEFTLDLCERFREAMRTSPPHAALGSAMAAWPVYLAGNFALAKELLAHAHAAAEEMPLVSFNLARTAIPLALHLDDPLMLRHAARPRLLESAFASNTPNVFGPVAAAIAQQFREQNRKSEAAALVTQAVKRIAEANNNVPLLIEAVRLDAAEAAPRAMSLLADLKDASRSACAAWHFCTALRSRGEQRREHAARAAELFGGIRWRVYQAEAFELAGETQQALEIYREIGSVAALRRLEAGRTPKTPSGLSPREWEVAALVAQGRSNRAIAETLVLSERTVENHIASIFAKLSLRSRAEIAALVARMESSAAEAASSSRAGAI